MPAEDTPDLPDINLFDAIVHRRTCRQFSSEPVEFEKIAQVIQAGMFAPSAGNQQNWQFIVVTDKEKLRSLYDHTLEQDVFHTAQIGVIICSDDGSAERYYGLRGKRLYTIQNCAACIQNMLLAAHSFNLGACWIGAFDEEKVDLMFSIPGNVRAQAIILFGYPDYEAEPKETKDISHLTFFNKYGERVKKPHLIFRDYSVEWEQRINAFKERARLAAPSFNIPKEKREEISKKSREFFDDAKRKLDEALDNLKDESKKY